MMLKVLVEFILCHQITAGDTGVHFWLYTKESILQNDYEVMNFDGENVILDENTKFDPSKPPNAKSFHIKNCAISHI